MAWTSANDVIGAWIGDGAPTDSTLVDLWIGRAERLLRGAVPDLQARLDAEAGLEPPVTDLLETVRDVVAEMVTELFRNPEGKRSSQTTTGPFSENVTFGGDNPGKLFVTADQLARLRGVTVGQRAFSVDLLPADSPFYLRGAGEVW